ncbi:MAG: O-antigen ligase family protein, partial [Planctomycetaceae bacterium]
FRMRGTGIFQDPNDLAMLIVATLVLCAYLRGDRRGGAMRWGWLGATALLAAGLFCTQSRGGLLAAGLAGVTFLALRYGKTAAVLAGALGAAGLALLSGRQTEIDLEGGTGRERLLLWRDGFEAIQSPEALFGIGYDAYADMAGLVAHNSFIHAFVELGLFGGTLFFGGFFFAALGLWRLRAALSVEQSRAVSARTGAARPGSVSELIRFHPYLAAVLAGWCGGMLSLSRCYVAPTYMVLGLAAVSLGMAGRSLAPPRLLVWWDARHVKQLLAASAGCLVSFYLVVKVLAH